jgi:surfactin synthase thioesterase subunit
MDEALELGDEPRSQRPQDAGECTVILGSGFDRYRISDAIGWWKDHLPGMTVELVEGGVHFLHATQPAEVVAALQRSLSVLEPQRAAA